MTNRNQLLTLWLGLFAFIGCGEPGEIRPEGSVDEARALLVQALDAWKSGASVEQLKEQDDPMIVSDDDWQSGRKLTSYELTEPAVEYGGHWRLAALLTIEKGPPVKTFYAVTPGNPASIIRSDFAE